MAELRLVRAEGDPFTRGSIVGSELRDLLNTSIDFYHRYLHKRGVSSSELTELLTPYLSAAETTYPSSMEVLKGMSAGAMVPVLELFAVNAFEELEPLLESPEGELLFLQRKEGYTAPPSLPATEGAAGRSEHCSSFTVSVPGSTIVAHNEHWLAGDLDNVAVVVDVPGDDVPVISPTVVCCLPAVGANGYGAAQGIGSLTASDDGPGIPRVMVSRSTLTARDREDAIAKAGVAGRAGGYGHVLGFRGGDAVTIETTATREAVMTGPGAHTNHYRDPGLAAIAPAPSEGSAARLGRIDDLLAERRPTTVQDVMGILTDHGSDPQAICLHPDPDEGEEASAVMFSMVAELESGRMWVAPGNPCETPYQEIDLAAVLND
ncbi:MAG: C45 family peptidase [Actinomycetota bacterium]